MVGLGSVKSKTIGIDLGNTKSVVGVLLGGDPVIIPDAHGRTSISSLDLVTPSEGFL